jgi:hypothetical protein
MRCLVKKELNNLEKTEVMNVEATVSRKREHRQYGRYQFATHFCARVCTGAGFAKPKGAAATEILLTDGTAWPSYLHLLHMALTLAIQAQIIGIRIREE